MTERVQEVNRLQKVLASATSKLVWWCQLACPWRYLTTSSSVGLRPSNTGPGEKVITGRATGAAQTQRAVRLVRVAVLREEEAEE